MKLFNIIGLALAAFCCVQVTEAQQASKKSAKLTAVVQLPGQQKPAIMELQRGDDQGNFYYLQRGTDQMMQARAASCAMFFIQTPADMGAALHDFYAGDLEDARKRFASVKKKYADYAGLPGSPCTMSALHELTCAVRLMDVAAVKTLADSIPGPKAITGANEARVAAAKVVGMITDTPESLQAITDASAAVLKEHGSNVDTEAYGWMRYAMGRASAAAAATAEDKTKAASQAVDYYCQAVMSMHGAHKHMPADALNRAIDLLWAQPGVQDYAGKVTAPLDKAAWNAAPADFRDAVAMAHYYKTMYSGVGTPSPQVDKLAPYFFNALKGVKKEK